MPRSSKINISLKTEHLLSLTGLLWLLIVILFLWAELHSSSPLVLFIISLTGYILSLRYKLAGGIFLFFGGLALVVHPFMFSTTYWLIPGAAVTGLAGFLILVNWWMQNEN